MLAAVLGTCTVTLGVAAATYGVIQYDGNLHEVRAGQVYRSAQLTGPALRHVIAAKGIRSVLNLRGDNKGRPWYDDEMSTARAEGVKHIDYSMSAQRELSVAQMRELAALIDQAPKPLLIHCNAGSDRTGLASALVVLQKTHDAEEARSQLSLHYGHFPYLWSKTDAMDRSFEAYVRAQANVGH